MRTYVVSIAMILFILTAWILGYLPLIHLIILSSIFSFIIIIDLKYSKEVNRNVEEN